MAMQEELFETPNYLGIWVTSSSYKKPALNNCLTKILGLTYYCVDILQLSETLGTRPSWPWANYPRSFSILKPFFLQLSLSLKTCLLIKSKIFFKLWKPNIESSLWTAAIKLVWVLEVSWIILFQCCYNILRCILWNRIKS